MLTKARRSQPHLCNTCLAILHSLGSSTELIHADYLQFFVNNIEFEYAIGKLTEFGFIKPAQRPGQKPFAYQITRKGMAVRRQHEKVTDKLT